MKAERLRAAGARREKRPCRGRSSLTLATFPRAGNNRGAMHNVPRLSSADFQTCRIADSPNRPGVSGARGGFGNLCCSAQPARSYSQLELVISRFLPLINLGGETGNY